MNPEIEKTIIFKSRSKSRGSNQKTPLDDFDYELAKRADENLDTETISMDDLLSEFGIDPKEIYEN